MLFRRIVVNRGKLRLVSSCPSACLPARTHAHTHIYISVAPTEKISVKLISETCTKHCRVQIWLQSDQNIGHVALTPEFYTVCGAKIQRTYDCGSVTGLSVFVTLVTATCVRQQCKGKALFRFPGNSSYVNTPHLHVIRTFPTLFSLN